MPSERFLSARTLLMPVVFAVLFLLPVGGVSDEPAANGDNALKLIPLPKKVPVPQDNPQTEAKVALGKQLFFDPRLSGDNRMSCATCHRPDPDKGFADGLARSKGAGGKRLSRNTPGLLNVAFYDTYFWDGRAESLEQQALGPIENSDEMNQDLAELERELNAVDGYRRQFQQVFGTPVSRDGIAKALAAFQRTLVSRDSPLDRYLQGETAALSDRARRGLELFTGQADCVRCHNGPLLSDGKYYRVGASFKDTGRENVTGKKQDRYKFRTPSLRDVARTGPYMHDGSMATLEEVVGFYLRSVPPAGPDRLPVDVEPQYDVSFAEVDVLVEFLKSLSGQPPKIEPPDLP